MIQGIDIAAMRGLDWLKKQKPIAVKDMSRSIQALSLWNKPASGLIELLLSMKKDGFWKTDIPLIDTARACSALAGCGLIQSDSLRWILDQQKNDNWSDSEIDTAYALIAFGDCGVKNEPGCEWLVRNYGEKWEHAGTTSLIITALLKQDGNEYRFFINDRAGWLLSKRLFGGWTHIATSNLAIQALVLAGERDIEKEIGPSIKWLMEKQVRDNWGNITASALSLISLRMYLDKLNSASDK
jgi:hypothetical protein